jgi:hypothetical protein
MSVASVSVQPRQLYVNATAGTDGVRGSGTLWNPFATIARAVTEVATLTTPVLIHLSPGTFKIAATINIPASVQIKGARKEQSIIITSATASPVFNMSNQSIISNVSIQGATGAAAVRMAVAGTSYVEDISVTNCQRGILGTAGVCVVERSEFTSMAVTFDTGGTGQIRAFVNSSRTATVDVNVPAGGTYLARGNFYQSEIYTIGGTVNADFNRRVNPQSFVVSTNNVGGNLNTVGVSTLNWTGTPTITNAIYGFTVGGQTVTINATGTYEVRFLIHNTTTSTRVNIRYTLLLNGGITNFVTAGNYIRSADNHNESGDCIVAKLALTAGNTLSIRHQQEAAVGNSTIVGNNCTLQILRLNSPLTY